MRWTEKPYAKPIEGNCRIRSGFLFLPLCALGEWRWLEQAKWEELYYGPSYDYLGGWAMVRWVDNDPR